VVGAIVVVGASVVVTTSVVVVSSNGDLWEDPDAAAAPTDTVSSAAVAHTPTRPNLAIMRCLPGAYGCRQSSHGNAAPVPHLRQLRDTARSTGATTQA
jgi:hypothetical protein